MSSVCSKTHLRCQISASLATPSPPLTSTVSLNYVASLSDLLLPAALNESVLPEPIHPLASKFLVDHFSPKPVAICPPTQDQIRDQIMISTQRPLSVFSENR